MTNEFIKTIISDTAYIIITSLVGIITYYIKAFLVKHSDFLKLQEETLKEQIGNEQYKQDCDIATRLVLRIEEEAKSYNWDSELKHSNAVKLISEKTGLSSEDIYDIIKSTVTKIKIGQVNAGKN